MLFLNGNAVNIGHFPDNTLLIKEYVKTDYTENRKAEITWKYENGEELSVLIFLTKHLKAHGVAKVTLNMPYIPNARQDRVKSDEDVFTLKYFAEVINWLGFDCVKVLDPHSNVSEALIDHLIVRSSKPFVNKLIEKIADPGLMLFYPDEGAMKRYSAYTDRPYAFGIKKRNWQTGKIEGLEVSGLTEYISGRNILIVDDLCSRGGTFIYSAKKLKELNAAKIYLFVSHCENTIFDGEVLTSGLIEKVYTTDSLLTKKHEKIEVLKNEEY